MALLSHYSDMIEGSFCSAASASSDDRQRRKAPRLRQEDNGINRNNDTEKKRMQLRELVMHEALTYGIGVVTAQEIDEINILNASFLAMHRALDQLTIAPELLLIDGNRFNPYKKIKHVCVVGGDAKYQAIAAASILAKTTRDMMMVQYDKQYPVYNWKKNKGYPTPEHKQAIADYGTTPLHRMTFNMAIQLKLDF